MKNAELKREAVHQVSAIAKKLMAIKYVVDATEHFRIGLKKQTQKTGMHFSGISGSEQELTDGIKKTNVLGTEVLLTRKRRRIS